MIFPQAMNLENENNQILDLPLLQEYAYDFKTNQFKLRDGKHYLVEGNEALKIWIYKALRTKRGRYIAYSGAFGSDVDELVGSNLGTDALKMEVERYVIECLMVCPYIESIERIDVELDEDRLIIGVAVKSVYGDIVEAEKCEIDLI